jgi:hypothetical protein
MKWKLTVRAKISETCIGASELRKGYQPTTDRVKGEKGDNIK